MTQIQEANNLTDLKQTYRDLAKRYHPDLGGNAQLMIQLNLAYQTRKQILSKGPQNFQHLKMGDKIYINGTESWVVLVTRNNFVARAKNRSKQAWFDKSTGKGIDYPYYQASFSKCSV